MSDDSQAKNAEWQILVKKLTTIALCDPDPARRRIAQNALDESQRGSGSAGSTFSYVIDNHGDVTRGNKRGGKFMQTDLDYDGVDH